MAYIRLFILWIAVVVLADTSTQGAPDQTANLDSGASPQLVNTAMASGSRMAGRGLRVKVQSFGNEPRMLLGNEPRVQLTNIASGLRLSFVEDESGKWNASSSCNFGRCDWFKLKAVATVPVEDGQVATSTLIQTDWHPQAVLDKNLNFEGGALNPWKGDPKSRWWDIIRIEIDLDADRRHKQSIFAFATSESRDPHREFLAMRGDKVFLKPINVKTADIKIDGEVQWSTRRVGTAATPAEAYSLFAIVPAATITAGLGAWAATYWAVGGVVGVGAVTATSFQATTATIVLALSSGATIMFEKLLPLFEAEASTLFVM